MLLTWTDYFYGLLTAAVSFGALWVALRMAISAAQCRARGFRLLMMLGGIATLFGLCVSSAYATFDNVVQHHNVTILPSAWLSGLFRGIIVLWFEVFRRYAIERADFEHRLEALATTDPLTGILNRRSFMERGHVAVEAAKRYGRPMAIMMVDIDNFKQVNDLHGHEAGDGVLRLVTSAIGKCLRQVDVFGRLGGEEFSVLMPETSQSGARIAAERIRVMVEEAKLDRNGQILSVTISAGLVVGTYGLDEALKLADEALYQAKKDGKNRVVMAKTDSEA
ncbi:MAG: GGDEF domain-containing protein [Rhodospirillales bacterium]|nr:GGDEF domain-containing protein [Rhodospirillales bacterium]